MPCAITARPFVPIALVLAAAPAAAQSLWAEKKGTLNSEALGTAIVALDDLDGDGVRDFAVSAPSHLGQAIGDGRVFVLSGATLSQIWASTGPVSHGDHGYAIAKAGDVDGDGLCEVLVGAPDLLAGAGLTSVGTAGLVGLRAGANGALLLQVPGIAAGDMFGIAVAGLSDVDGDGVPDFAVGASGSDVAGTDSGSVRFVSGTNGATLFTVLGLAAGDGFGSRMAAIDDLDGDGKLDLLVAALGVNLGTENDVGAVFLLSGASGSTLHTWYGPEALALYGFSVADLGDLDGDGSADVGVGAVQAEAAGVGPNVGAIFAYSGATKDLIFARYGDLDCQGLGQSIAALEDVSGDGRPEVVASGMSSPMGTFSGQARVLAGTTGAELGRVYGEDFETLSWAVASLGDLNGDGGPEFAVGGFDQPNGLKGVLRIYSAGLPMPPASYCTAKINSQGCAPTLSAQGTPSLSGADDFVVTAGGLINNKPGLFLWGADAKLQFVFNALLCIAPPTTRTPAQSSGGNPGSDDCSGSLSFHFSHAYLAQHGLGAGADVHVQAWYRDPALPFAPAGLSNALAFFLAP